MAILASDIHGDTHARPTITFSKEIHLQHCMLENTSSQGSWVQVVLKRHIREFSPVGRSWSRALLTKGSAALCTPIPGMALSSASSTRAASSFSAGGKVSNQILWMSVTWTSHRSCQSMAFHGRVVSKLSCMTHGTWVIVSTCSGQLCFVSCDAALHMVDNERQEGDAQQGHRFDSLAQRARSFDLHCWLRVAQQSRQRQHQRLTEAGLGVIQGKCCHVGQGCP